MKETGARAGDLWRVTIKDIDFDKRFVYFNMPEKRSNSRAIKVSKRLVNMIQELHARTQNSKVFQWESDNLRSFTRIFEKHSKKASIELQNPKFLKISFKTLRHWKGTMEYRKTRNILHVKGILGRKAISNTLKYIHLAEMLFDNPEDHTCRFAETIKEASSLIESGFECVTEIDGVKLFRKRK